VYTVYTVYSVLVYYDSWAKELGTIVNKFYLVSKYSYYLLCYMNEKFKCKLSYLIG